MIDNSVFYMKPFGIINNKEKRLASLKEASLLGSEQKKKKSNPKNKPKTNPKQPKNPKQQKNVLTQRQNIRPTHSTFIPAIASYLKKTLLKVNQRLF